MLIALWKVLRYLSIVLIAYGAAIVKHFGTPVIVFLGIAVVIGGVSGVKFCSNAGSAVLRYLIQGLGYIIRTLIQAIGWLLRYVITSLPTLWKNSKEFFMRANLSEPVSSVLATVITVLVIIVII